MNLAGWMNQTITVQSVTSRSTHGDPVYGSKVTVPARVEPSQRVIRTANGDEAQSSYRIYTLVQINLTDRIWLPGVNTSINGLASVPLATRSSVNKTVSTILYTTDL